MERKIVDALPTLAELDPEIEWLSPLEADSFAELWDAPLVESMGRADLVPKLAEYWPKQGPHWDAVAVARGKDGNWLGPILVEAKSYPEEMVSACKAEKDRGLIEQRLAETREWLRKRTGGPSEDHAGTW